MMLIRVIAIATLIWVAYLVIKGFAGRLRQNQESNKKISTSKKMVRCDACGVHIPEDQAFKSGDAYYCEEHRPS